MEILIIGLLILLNGLFAMAEIAIVSAKKADLHKQSSDGKRNAKVALYLAKSPNRFLSTIQIGITFVGIFAGAFSGKTIAKNLADKLDTYSFIAPYGNDIALLIVVLIITYFSLVLGELVPKRIGLNHSTAIAKAVALPMNFISKVLSPMVSLLSFSTDLILKILNIKHPVEPEVSEEEVKMLIREGARVGIFNLAEKDIVERTFRLADKSVAPLMTPRKEIVWLDVDSSFRSLRDTITEHPHSHFPVCRGGLDRILGIVRTKNLLTDFLNHEKIDLLKLLQKPLFIPENMAALKVLELFKKAGVHLAVIIDEYGNINGIVTLTDILQEIVGELPVLEELEEKEIVKREDGSWLVDGLISIDDFKEYFKISKIPDEKTGRFHTIGGFVVNKLDRIPTTGDHFEWDNLIFEVVDMDKHRVDKILIKQKSVNTDK